MNTDFNYKRRVTWQVNVGSTPLGAKNPIRVQSMTSTNTNDIEASVVQCRRIAEAGGEYVRLTAQGVREAESIGLIREQLRKDGCNVPLVADIHFNPKAAFAAAEVTDKVRINPGNFVDAARTFKKLTFTDEEYAEEIKKIEKALVPFIELCKQKGTAVRIGVNHGSLSDRIMSRYGDTPAGMVESAMEFLRVFVAHDFKDVVISIKASNTVIMVETVRRLVEAMDAEEMHFPLHLGVTEAGDGEDGRIKSAVGIGTLLSEGIGDTIRVSLSEDPELEVPVAKRLVEYVTSREFHPRINDTVSEGFSYIQPKRRSSVAVGNIGGGNQPIVVSDYRNGIENAPMKADYYYCTSGVVPKIDLNVIIPLAAWYNKMPQNVSVIANTEDFDDLVESQCVGKWLWVDANGSFDVTRLKDYPDIIVALYTTNANIPASLQAFLHRMITLEVSNPVVLRCEYSDIESEAVQVKAGVDLGTPLMNGFRDGIWISDPYFSHREDIVRYEFAILQAARLRMSKTEFISCPSCGRTLFDLQTTVKRVKEATSHLKHLKIGIMGCIVNGPGEMADADYGYVGAAPNKVSLYKGKQCVEMNIPQEDAIERLVEIIKQNGDWVDP